MKYQYLFGLFLALALLNDCGSENAPDVTFRVSYAGNGATGGTLPTDDAAYHSGDAVIVLPPGSLAKTGSLFEAWTDSTGASLEPGDTFVMRNMNVVLYASWSAAPTHIVLYNGNGNTGGAPPTDGKTYPEGATVTVAGPGTMTRDGFAFAGWTTGATTYQQGNTFTIGATNVTLIAVWSPTYVVSYSGNGETSGTPPANASYVVDATVTVAAPVDLAQTGSCFAFWNTAADRSGARYDATDQFAMPAASVTLYAQWNTAPTLAFNGVDAGTDNDVAINQANAYTANIIAGDADFTLDAAALMSVQLTLANIDVGAAVELNQTSVNAAIASTGSPTYTVTATAVDFTGTQDQVNAVLASAEVLAPGASGTATMSVMVDDGGFIGGCNRTAATTLHLTYSP